MSFDETNPEFTSKKIEEETKDVTPEIEEEEDETEEEEEESQN